MLRAVLRLNRFSKQKDKEKEILIEDKDKMVKKAVIFLADKAEEAEVIIPVDTLRRAGVEVVIAGVDSNQPVTCIQHVRILPDVELDRLTNEIFDVVILPGGPGSDNLIKVPLIKQIVEQQANRNKLIAAICAGTKCLKEFNINYGSKITTYPKYRDELNSVYKLTNDRVCVDGNLITSQGPGTAFEFALTIVKHLFSEDKSKELAELLRVEYI